MFLEALSSVSPGTKARAVNAFVETPKGSRHECGVREDGLLSIFPNFLKAGHSPCSFSYLPRTIAPAGDALDIVLPAPGPIPARALIDSRPVGVLPRADVGDSGMARNERVVAMANMSRGYGRAETFPNMRHGFARDVDEFFETYNDIISALSRSSAVANGMPRWRCSKRPEKPGPTPDRPFVIRLKSLV